MVLVALGCGRRRRLLEQASLQCGMSAVFAGNLDELPTLPAEAAAVVVSGLWLIGKDSVFSRKELCAGSWAELPLLVLGGTGGRNLRRKVAERPGGLVQIDTALGYEPLVAALRACSRSAATVDRGEKLDELNARMVKLQALAVELTQTQQRERRRLGLLLHDHLQQLLVSAKLRLASSQRSGSAVELEEVDALLARSIEASRSLSTELSPPILYDAGLPEALEWLARRFARERGLPVHLNLEQLSDSISDDGKAFVFQAADELLFNVVKHADATQAELSLNGRDGRLTLMVKDNGSGFADPETVFNRPHEDGFGLFSLRERLARQGGSLEVTSAAGAGAAVTLMLPIAESSAIGRPVAKPQSCPGNGKSGELATAASPGVIRVLLADDHKLLREGLANLLRDQPGIEVVSEACDGEMAVELARQWRPDVVLMDVSMPRLSGPEATRVISRELPDVQVIGLSMHDRSDMASAMFEAGAAAYVTKGAPSENLIAAIRDCFEAPAG
jgi:signal transduction histidine kinase/CheY-like chemotaxis protein